MTSFNLHSAAFSIENNRGRLAWVGKGKLVDGALVADGQMRIDGVVGNRDLIVIRCHALMIPVCRDDGTQLVALRDTQPEGTSLAMIGDDDGQAVEVLCNIFVSRRIDAHQAIWQLNGRKAGNQQMTDASDVRIHVIDGFCSLAKEGCKQRYKEDFPKQMVHSRRL